jgi:hypothetical protein
VAIPELNVANPNVILPGQFGGFMGRKWDPEFFQCDPSAADFHVDGLELPADVPAARLWGRKGLLDEINRYSRLAGERLAVQGHDRFAAQAVDMLASGSARKAFALEEESSATRDRYGRGKWGQSVLLARRLIEAQVRMVFVNWPREPGDLSANNPLWDTHSQNNPRMKDVLCPQFDLGFSALVEDLAERGLLEETLVVAIGEMGRTPKFNAAGGRDHWGNVFSFVLSGAGIQGGQVHGSSDNNGALPASGLVEPQDLTATILHLLGIHHETTFRDRTDRPVRASEGTPLLGILAGRPPA